MPLVRYLVNFIEILGVVLMKLDTGSLPSSCNIRGGVRYRFDDP